MTLSDSTSPAIRYLSGDSVSIPVAEFCGATSKGFEHLSGDHARDVFELSALAPRLPQSEDGSFMISPVLSVQVTLFPDQGFSVGLSNSHVVADGNTMSKFIKTWASISAKQLACEDDCDNLDSLPFYDRNVIEDPKGMASIFLRECLGIAHESANALAQVELMKDLVQATLKMNRAQTQGLKNLVTARFPHVSAFVVVCAYVWTCMAKTSLAVGQEISDENEEEIFTFMMDTRARLDPPINLNYFGNALLPCRCSVKSSQLVGEEGFVIAVEEIKKVLDGKLNNEKWLLEGLEMVFDLVEATKGQKKFGVGGSPKFEYYSTDFGWGKPKKYEIVLAKFGLVRSRDSDGDLEIGFSFSTYEMDAFTLIFTQGLIN